MAGFKLHSRLSRLAIFSLIVLLVTALTACPRPLVSPAGSLGDGGTAALDAHGDAVTGKVSFSARSIQASIKDDIAPGATISLIEVQSGRVLTTARTDADGTFVLKYSNGFKPQENAIYYFEAIKGLAAGVGQPNAVGADAVRVRTIASYRRGGWVTLSSGTVGRSIYINPMTTALAVVVSLRETTTAKLDPRTLFGAIKVGRPQGAYPDAVEIADPSLRSLVQRTYELVMDALQKERDPMRWVALNPDNPNVVYLPAIPFSIKLLSPSIQQIGGNIDIIGTNFADTVDGNKVSFMSDAGWLPATVNSVSPDLTRLNVTVPSGAVNGRIRLEIDGKILASDYDFQVAVVDGHSVVRNNLLYVANPGLNTITAISPTGEVTPVITNLPSPKALTFGPDNALYVACGGTERKVVRIPFGADSKPVISQKTTYSGTIADPSGMAFGPSGDLFVADIGLPNRIYRVASSSTPVSLPQTTTSMDLTGVPLNGPRGLSFGADGKTLYVANSNANNVLAIDTESRHASEFLSGLSRPWSLAFDSKGNFYVSNNTGNSIFRLEGGVLSAFASVPSPGGLDADPSGYIYCADNVSNQIYVINSQGEARMLATGVSSPMGVHVGVEKNAQNQDETVLYTVTEGGQILRASLTTQTLSVFADGLTGAETLARDSDGNFYVFQRSLRRISRVSKNGAITGFLPVSNVNNIYVSGTKLYLSKSNTHHPDGAWSSLGGIEVRDLSNWAATEKIHLSFIRDVYGMTFDDSAAGAYRNWVYFANYGDRSVSRMDPTLKIKPFLSSVPRPNAVTRTELAGQPTDVWVNPSNGQVWVVVHGTSTANDGLYVYDPVSGAQLADYSAVVNRPIKIDYDGAYLYLADYGSNRVRKLDPANGAVLKDYAVTGARALTFDTAANVMYVGTQSGVIYKVANYSGATPDAAAVYYSKIPYTSGDLMFSDGAVHVAIIHNDVKSSYRIDPDASTHYVHRNHYQTISDFAKRKSDGAIFLATRLGHYSGWGSNHAYTTGSLLASAITASVDGRGNWVALFEYNSSGMRIMVGKEDDTEQSTSHTISRSTAWVRETAMTSDGNGNVFIVTNPGAKLHRFTTTDGSLLAFANRNYGSTDRGFGVAVSGGKVYQTVKTQHRIDVFNAVTGAFEGLLPIGLVTPEL